MSDYSTVTAEFLLAHQRFVHAVARDLLRDEHAAEDVVQDTWVQALQRGPRSLLALPGWLRAVATNRARDVRRSAARRQRREALAPSAAGEAIGDTAARLALQRDVVGAVLELTEPYKTVVLLRYYHGLEPTEIAARLGGKPSTVRTQLVRAHEQLRERLDRDHGGRAAWAAVLLPASAAEVAPAAAGHGVLKAAIALTLLATVAFGFFAWHSDDPVPAPPVAAAAFAADAGTPVNDPDRTLARVALPPPPAVRQDVPPPSSIPEVITARAVLREQDSRRGYGTAGFSFLHAYGGVGRTGKDKARGDCDVVLQQGRFRADSVSDDRSLIVDLGALPLAGLTRGPLDGLLGCVRDAAERRYARMSDRNVRSVVLPVEAGHAYFVWTNDPDSDHAAVFEVVERPARDTCVLEWYWTEDGTWARGSTKSPGGDRTLAAAIVALRDVARPLFDAALEREVGPKRMRQPVVVLQARSGAVGGNPCRIDIGRGHSQYFDRISRDPITLPTPIAISDDSVGHCSGGLIPEDCKLVITSATWSGEAHGDSNGHGCFHVQLGDQELVRIEKSDAPIAGSWSGRVELAPGEEERAFLEISNSCQGEVVFTGRFEKLPN